MRKGVLALIVVLGAAFAAPRLSGRPAREELRGRLSVSGAWALYPLAIKWAEEFQRLHPGVRIDIQAGGAGKGVADVLGGAVDIGMASREISPAEREKGAVAVAVAKDAVVATLNPKNPFLDDLRRRGLRKEDLVRIWITQTARTWGALVGRTDGAAIHVYTRSDACGAAETWAAYLGRRQEDLAGVGVYGDPGLAEAVKRDPLGIGYNNISFAYDLKTNKPVDGLAICPLDLNGNGRLDPEERIYDTRSDLIRAIAANVYPSPPARDLYFVMRGRPGGSPLVEFMKWVLTDGQKYVTEMGYLPLGPERTARSLALVGGPGAGRK